jgi:hypothetical protein
MPVQVRKGIAVHQQQGWTAPTRHRDDTRAAGLDFRSLEAVEHGFRKKVVPAVEASITIRFAARGQQRTKIKR